MRNRKSCVNQQNKEEIERELILYLKKERNYEPNSPAEKSCGNSKMQDHKGMQEELSVPS